MAKKKTRSKKSRAKRPPKKAAKKTSTKARARKPPAAPPRGLGFAAGARPAPGPPKIEVDFLPRDGDEDVSGKSDGDLGHTIRMKTERGDGAWVFEALDTQLRRRRWLRTVVQK